MLNKEVFKSGIQKLVIEFENKGFTMTKQKAEIWYEYMKSMEEEEFNQRIDYVLRNSSFPPVMADILKVQVDMRTQQAYAALERLKGGIEF